MKSETERAMATVPRWVLALLAAAFLLQVTWQALQPKPSARAEALGPPAPPAALRALAMGEPIALAQLLTLYLQAFDNQPGISIPFRDLDYARVAAWLGTILTIDPVARHQYEHLEYKPLVNARAHSLGKRRQIVNDRLYEQYHKFLKVLSYHNSLNDTDLAAGTGAKTPITLWMIGEGRYEPANFPSFTIDPASGDTEHLVIEGSFGLGESVVSGQVSPDRWVVEKGTMHILKRDVKRKELVIEPLSDGGTATRELRPDEATKPPGAPSTSRPATGSSRSSATRSGIATKPGTSCRRRTSRPSAGWRRTAAKPPSRSGCERSLSVDRSTGSA